MQNERKGKEKKNHEQKIDRVRKKKKNKEIYV
jgi:hypothetical protein